MRRQPSLRAQLNQIRMWVRQGRTDAWIAHKIDVSVDELARFKREHDLEGGDEGPRGRPADAMSVPPPDPRSEDSDDEEEEEEEDAQPAQPAQRERPRSRNRRRPRRPAAATAPAGEDEDEAEPDEDGERLPAPAADGRESEDGEADAAARRRRRGRRGGRRHRARRKAYEATFDHGDEGYGLWLDPAVTENPVYSEHWAGHRAVTVTFDAEAITIRRVDSGQPDSGPDGDE